MSWLDDDAYKNDRDELAERLRRREVVLVVDHLAQGLAHPANLASFAGTALDGPTLPVIDLRRWGKVVDLTQGAPVFNATAAQGDLESLFKRLDRKDAFVLRLRGPEGGGAAAVILSDADVRSNVLRSPMLTKLLQEIVETRTLALVGVDPVFLRSLIPGWTASSRRHYAVHSYLVDASQESQRALERELNLRIFSVSPPPPDPGEVLRGLDWIARHGRQASPQAVEPASHSRIESVRLHQIGPYDELTFQPGQGWNVLLGPNGHGKTTILRAIALGLLGDDPRAQPAAASLLRVGAAQGAVELRVGGRDFRIDLYREGTAVHVRTDKRSPLQALGVTMLGFPALRGASGAPATPFFGEPNAKPDAGDLLPLVQGGADPRIATVRQWIAQTRLRAELERARNPDAARRFDAALDRFFGMMTELLPGLTLRLGRIEPTTGQVWVVTDAGEVPLDALSQGTTAVLGWIGTLLLRLLETHPESEQPEREHAIVLADEIDAHMHPEWQQALVGLVRERLPNLQVIATSHSPLVVGSLGDGKVFRVPRLSEATRVTLAPIEEPFTHYRADQILTSPAFGLDHTVSAASVALLDEYARLHATTVRTPDEEQQYQALRKQVREELPASPETPEAREALAAVEKALVERQLQNPQRALANAQALLAMLEKEP